MFFHDRSLVEKKETKTGREKITKNMEICSDDNLSK